MPIATETTAAQQIDTKSSQRKPRRGNFSSILIEPDPPRACARFSPAMIVLTFSRLIITQTKIRLSKRSKSITDAASRLQRE
jgi:hypothetical protein